MKKIILLVLMLTVAIGLFANGLSLNSVGPRSLAMGGAFIGLANDGSAIYWNPAGLTGQPTAIKGIFTDVMPFSNYRLDMPELGPYNPNVDADSEVKHYPNPNLFFNMTKDKWAFGLGIYVPAGLGATYDGEDLTALSGGEEVEWMSKIGVINIAPAVAYEFSEKLSLGVAANIYYGMFDLKRPAVIENVGVFQYDESSTGLGYGATIGLMFRPNEAVNFGLTYRTATEVAMEGEAENPAFGAMGAEAKSDFDRDVTWPLWLGAGFAFHLSEKVTVTCDAQYSRWSSVDKFVTEFDDATWAATTEATGDNEFILKWKDAIQYRLGWEYQMKPCFALRGGYYYDPAPAPQETLNILFPSSTNSVLTGGFGYTKGKLDIDFGLEYLFGYERNAIATEHSMPGNHQMDVFAYSLGIGYRF